MSRDEDFDSLWDDDSLGSEANAHKSARVPTIQELNAQIIRLERENFQLKLRVHMNETRGTASPITSTPDTVSKKSTIGPKDTDKEKEIQVLTQEKEQLEMTLQQKESQLCHEIKQKDEALHRESILHHKITELASHVQILEREKALHRLRQGYSSSASPSSTTSTIFSAVTPIMRPQKDIHPQQLNYSTAEDLDWYRKYNQVLLTLQAAEDDLHQCRAQLQSSNDDRHSLVNQLAAFQDFHTQELLALEKSFKHQINDLLTENVTLKSTIEELRLTLEKTKDRLESLKKAANFELSNQLVYHQSALEKVHQEQALMIAELQNLKKAYPVKKSVEEIKDFRRKVEDIEAEVESDKNIIIDSTEFLMTSRQGRTLNNISHEPSVCLIDLSTPRPQFLPKVSTENEDEDRISCLNKQLHEKNSKLAIKLKKTRESLKAAIAMLENSEKDKEGMEKIICRQLHKTHKILSDVKGAMLSVQSKETSSQEKCSGIDTVKACGDDHCFKSI